MLPRQDNQPIWRKFLPHVPGLAVRDGSASVTTENSPPPHEIPAVPPTPVVAPPVAPSPVPVELPPTPAPEWPVVKLAQRRGSYPLIGGHGRIAEPHPRQKPRLRGKNRRWLGEKPPTREEIISRLTERDVRALVAIGKFGMLLADQIATLADDDQGHWRNDVRLVKNRMGKLANDGFVSVEPCQRIGARGFVYTLGPNGWTVVNRLTGLTKRSVAGKAYDHEITVADTAILLLSENPGAAWIAESEIRALLVAKGLETEWSSYGTESSKRGKALGKANRVPDGMLVYPKESEKEPVAVEIQLSNKTEAYFTKRCNDLVNAYSGLNMTLDFSGVLWVVVSQSLEVKLRTLFGKISYGSSHSVRRVTQGDGIRVFW